jgi:hypothetical protein
LIDFSKVRHPDEEFNPLIDYSKRKMCRNNVKKLLEDPVTAKRIADWMESMRIKHPDVKPFNLYNLSTKLNAKHNEC